MSRSNLNLKEAERQESSVYSVKRKFNKENYVEMQLKSLASLHL